MSLTRRKVILISGAVGGGVLAGGYILSGRPGGDESQRQLPADLEELHIASDTEHLISAGDNESYQIIRWENQGTLVIESGGSLSMRDIKNA